MRALWMACSAGRAAAVCMAVTVSNPQGTLPLARICSVTHRKGCASRGRGGGVWGVSSGVVELWGSPHVGQVCSSGCGVREQVVVQSVLKALLSCEKRKQSTVMVMLERVRRAEVSEFMAAVAAGCAGRGVHRAAGCGRHVHGWVGRCVGMFFISTDCSNPRAWDAASERACSTCDFGGSPANPMTVPSCCRLIQWCPSHSAHRCFARRQMPSISSWQ